MEWLWHTLNILTLLGVIFLVGWKIREWRKHQLHSPSPTYVTKEEEMNGEVLHPLNLKHSTNDPLYESVEEREYRVEQSDLERLGDLRGSI